MDRPPLRASDAERDAIADRLRDGAAEGRLEPSELEERVELAYGARTRTELLALVADLPQPKRRRRPRRPERIGRLGLYGIANSLLVLLWAGTAGMREPVLGIVQGPDVFWPIVPIVAWGLALAARRRRPHAAALLTPRER